MSCIVVSSHPESFALQKELESLGIKTEHAEYGKNAQLKIAEKTFEFAVIDFDVTNHGFIPLIKFLKIHSSKTVVFLILSSPDLLKNVEITQDDLKKMGIAKAIPRPWSGEVILKLMREFNPYSHWKTLGDKQPIESIGEDKEEVLNDRLFTSVPIGAFGESNLAIFDTYIRIGPNKYIKIVLRGEYIDKSRYRRYVEGYNVSHLYFKTEERSAYINFMNETLERLSSSKKLKGTGVEKVVTSVAEKFIEEVYVKGIAPQVYDEGLRVCNNILSLMDNNSQLKGILQKIPNSTRSHQVLTAIYSVSIAKSEVWVGKKTMQNIVMGAMLHSIGLLKLPWYDHEARPRLNEMNEGHLQQFKRYPEFGYEMLKDVSHIPEAVKQIVLQHAEMADGSGFPVGLNHQRTYPLARIVGLASYFSDKILYEGKPPLEVIKMLISDRTEVVRFNGVLLKSLIQGFVK